MTTTFHALAGGMLIGIAAIFLLLADGEIAGISGMLGGLVRGVSWQKSSWRAAFLAGLFAGGWLMQKTGWSVFEPLAGRSIGALAAAGLLVGFGTQLGSGCTSGHGVCGVARLSRRSIAATIAFMATGAATVYLTEHVLGGVL